MPQGLHASLCLSFGELPLEDHPRIDMLPNFQLACDLDPSPHVFVHTFLSFERPAYGAGRVGILSPVSPSANKKEQADVSICHARSSRGMG